MSATDICTLSELNEAELRHLQSLVATAQAELAKLEASLNLEKHNVEVLHATLFRMLRPGYEQRDRLRLIVEYRKKFLDELISADAEAAATAQNEFAKAAERAEREYESTATEFEAKRKLSDEDEQEVKELWKKLVRLFHPDRIFDDPKKRETYQRLTQAINHARDTGDLDALREIARDPEEFICKQGWASVELAPEKELKALRSLLEMLESKIGEIKEITQRLKMSSDYELYSIWRKHPLILDQVAEKQRRAIEAECVELTQEAAELGNKIQELSGESPFGDISESVTAK